MRNPFEIQAKGTLTRVYIGRKTTVWFSYETPIAFAIDGYGTVKSENVWTQATGKHLNSIPARDVLPNKEFNDRLAVLADGFDTESQSTIESKRWTDPGVLHINGAAIRRRNDYGSY